VKRLWLIGLIAVLMPALTACAGSAQSTNTPQPSDTPLAPQTATIVWFPATPTHTATPLPSIQPTPEQRPGIEAILLEDDFKDPTQWSTTRTQAGSVAFGKQELTIAIAEPKSTLLSLRKAPELSDFYLEITTNASLCRQTDSYGLLLRAASELDFYRFMIACNGQLRLERIKGGQAVLLKDWTPSGQVLPGSPLVLRVGVWAYQNELRFFINDFYQFSARDTIFRSGRVGVYARSTGQNAVSVSFSGLAVYEIDRAIQLPTATVFVTNTRVIPTRLPTLTPLPPRAP